MPRRINHVQVPTKRVYFHLRAPEAKGVVLCGNFNGWDTHSRVLKCNWKGVWTTHLALQPGIYEYRFLVDGEWQNDPDAALVPNPYGTRNSVKIVTR